MQVQRPQQSVVGSYQTGLRRISAGIGGVMGRTERNKYYGKQRISVRQG